jgi:DNA-directed RNA polymerase II subunit RPB2
MSDNPYIKDFYSTQKFKSEHSFDSKKHSLDVMDAYLDQDKIMVKHQIEAFDYLMLDKLPKVIEERNPLKFYDAYNEKLNKNMKEYHISLTKFTFSKPIIKEPDGSVKTMYPHHARLRNFTYSSSLYCNIEHKLVKHSEDGTSEIIEFEPITKHPCGMTPIMLGSSLCVLSNIGNRTKREMSECAFDDGGYYIVGGGERVLVYQEKKADNHVFCFTKSKGSGNTVSKYSHIADITSIDPKKPFNQNNIIQVKVQSKRSHYGGHLLRISLKSLKKDIPVMLIFKAFSIISDKSILEHIVHDVTDEQNLAIMQFLRPSLEEVNSIQNPEEALTIIAEDFNLKNMFNLNDKVRYENVYRNLVNELFPHICADATDLGFDMVDKLYYLGYTINRLVLQVLEKLPLDDRDSFINKRIENSCDLITGLYRNNLAKMIRDLSRKIQKEIRNGRIEEIHTHLQKDARSPNIDSGIKYAFSTGNWGPKNQQNKSGVSQVLQRKSNTDTVSNKRRIVNPMNKQSKQYEPRKLHSTSWGYIDPSETPEGSNVGIVKNLALTAFITLESDHTPVERALKAFGTIPLRELKPFQIHNKARIFLNGRWIGIHTEPHILYAEMKRLKWKDVINIYTSISWDIENDLMQIHTDSGRLTRPLFIVRDNEIMMTIEILNKLKSGELMFSDLLIKGTFDENGDEMGIIEYVDVYESNTSLIALNYDVLRENSKTNNTFKNFTHCEINEVAMLGAVMGHIPMLECNQGPRNLFIGAQYKQAVSPYATNFNERMDTIAHVLHYPQKPILNTRIGKKLHGDIMPAGNNAILAIASYTGYNQEDSLVFNKYSVDRGFMNSSFYRTYKDEEKKNQSNLEEEKFCRPDRSKTSNFKIANYSKLDDNGFVKVGTRVKPNDVLIGKTIPVKVADDEPPKYKDASVVMRQNEAGSVDRVYANRNSEGFRFVKVRIRGLRIPEIGDKFASNCAQKGTIGMMYNQEDLFFTEEGISPDVFLNPFAFPKRMTIGQFVNTICGKLGACKGMEIDGTPMQGYDVSTYGDALQKYSGYHHSGKEVVYNGFTGEQILCDIFIGPTYYLRLKHMVSDKLHARASGPTTSITRQPTEGRNRDGGLRLGEMERDALLGHAAVKLLKERTFDCSDKYVFYVCKACHTMAAVNPTENMFKCTYCDRQTEFAQVRISYACKQFFQEMQAMMILVRIYTG